LNVYVWKIKPTRATLFISSLIFRPTHLRFFDICLLLVIMTVAIHSYREKEEKAVDVVVATTIYPYIFFFSLISCFFSCHIIIRNQKKNRCTNTFCSPLFSLRIGQSEVYRCSLVPEEHKERKKMEGKHQLQNR